MVMCRSGRFHPSRLSLNALAMHHADGAESGLVVLLGLEACLPPDGSTLASATAVGGKKVDRTRRLLGPPGDISCCEDEDAERKPP